MRRHECNICMQGYDLTEHRPKVLPCGHTFCGACLTQSIESCPFDRKPFMVPMPDNFFVLDLLQWEQLSCAVHEDTSAVAFCVQHLQPLCEICGPRHSCSIEMLADFDMTNFLLKELNCDPALSPLSNREKLNRLRLKRGLSAPFPSEHRSAPELVWDRFQRLLPKKRAYETYAWRLGISDRQVEALCLCVNTPVRLTGLGIGAPIDKNSIARIESAWICQGDRMSREGAIQLLLTTDLSASKPLMKLPFLNFAQLEPRCWYTLVVRMTGGRVFAGRPGSSRSQANASIHWEVKDPADTGEWLVTGSSSRGGPLLQLFYCRDS